MKKEIQAPDQEYRIERLRELLKHPEFDGNKAALGRFLGYQGGAYIRQMLEGERPIHETTIRLIETAKAGKFSGWFAKKEGLTPPALRLAQMFDEMVPEPLRQATYTAMLNQIELAVAAARTAREIPDPTPTAELQPHR